MLNVLKSVWICSWAINPCTALVVWHRLEHLTSVPACSQTGTVCCRGHARLQQQQLRRTSQHPARQHPAHPQPQSASESCSRVVLITMFSIQRTVDAARIWINADVYRGFDKLLTNPATDEHQLTGTEAIRRINIQRDGFKTKTEMNFLTCISFYLTSTTFS